MAPPTQSAPRLIWRLVEESLSEAAFLWQRLDTALDAADYALADVERWVQGRLFGALDGVLVAGASAIDPLLAPAVRDSDPGLVSVAAYCLACLQQPRAERELELAVREAGSDQVEAFARALGRAGAPHRLHALWGRLQDASSMARAAVLRALSFCGEAPSADWRSLLAHPDPGLRRAAATALRFAAPAVRAGATGVAVASTDSEVRARTVAASVLAGEAHGWRRCVECTSAADISVSAGALLTLAAMLGTPREVARVIAALDVAALRPDALRALASAGTAAAVEACLGQWRRGEHVQLAAEAVAAITGYQVPTIAPPRVVPVRAAAGEADSEEPLDLDDPPTALPDLGAAEQWWATHRGAFERDARYLCGRPMTLAWLIAQLKQGPTARRHALAWELSVRSRGAIVLQTLDFCCRQRAQLSRLDVVSARELRQSAQALGVQPLGE